MCMISFAWDPLSCSEQAGIENFRMKIYVSRKIRTHATPQPVNQRFKIRPLSHSVKISSGVFIVLQSPDL